MTAAQKVAPPVPDDCRRAQNPKAVRACLFALGVTPLAKADFAVNAPAKTELGRLLFFDRILSGNKNVACSSCHAPRRNTSDGASTPPSGGDEGAIGRFLFPSFSRNLGRNAIDLFNRGHKSFTKMFADSRVRVDRTVPQGFATPAGNELPFGLDSALAAQALFPLLQADEMLGHATENEIAALPSSTAIWAAFTARVTAIPKYRSLLAAAYPNTPIGKVGIQHIANAIAAFEADFFRADDSPFDRFLRGDDKALNAQQLQGARLFYNESGCGRCHAGTLQTDNQHYAVAIPQFGRGKGDGDRAIDDFGLERVTHVRADRYKFRTPSLRNVAVTGPWGHDGAYADLAAVVRHFANPARGFKTWKPSQAKLVNVKYPTGYFDAYFDASIAANILSANQLDPVPLSEPDVQAIVAFLRSLTDITPYGRRHELPLLVPSGKRDVISLLPSILYSGDTGLRVGILHLGIFDREIIDSPFAQDLLGL